MTIGEKFGRFFNRGSRPSRTEDAPPDDLEGLTAYLVSHVSRNRKLLSGAGITGASAMTELGLDSLAMFRLSKELEERLGVSIEPELVFEVTTLSALAEALHSIRLQGQIQQHTG